MADCELCSRPQVDTAYACSACSARTADALHAAAELWPDLQDVVAGRTRYGDPTPRAGRPAPAQPIRPGLGNPADDHQRGDPDGLVVDLRAARVRDDMRNDATGWARIVQDERGLTPPVDTPALLRWLAGQVEWFRHQPFGADALDGLAWMARRISPAVDRPPRRVDAGECGMATLGGPCRQRLTAPPGAAIVHCPACRATHRADERREVLLEAARGLRATATECAQWLTILGWPTPAATVRKWAERDRIRSDAWGRYAFREVEELRLGMVQRRKMPAAA